ncbi:hypothetical protein QYE76_066814 [Lolium multiflorum]|uniref:Uncharacterized protein n=1 Tax=Lolium multiflorum TaxID=4521 RepID=A0AAD8WCE8_LOLMU|nr:hypothetical protein QYE76_066814 [Lolium multiflorum]
MSDRPGSRYAAASSRQLQQTHSSTHTPSSTLVHSHYLLRSLQPGIITVRSERVDLQPTASTHLRPPLPPSFHRRATSCCCLSTQRPAPSNRCRRLAAASGGPEERARRLPVADGGSPERRPATGSGSWGGGGGGQERELGRQRLWGL